jgi:hypothetical protein
MERIAEKEMKRFACRMHHSGKGAYALLEIFSRAAVPAAQGIAEMLCT